MRTYFIQIIFIIGALFKTSAGQAQVELVTDGGFETGPAGTAWAQSSINFPTPICDLFCGNGGGSGPHTGNFWAWFGGFMGGIETGTLSQTINIPLGGTVSLTFWLEQIECDSPQDFLRVTVDGVEVFLTDGNSALCGVFGYSLQTIDISVYADGNPHVLVFTSTTISAQGGQSNFFVDDVSVISTAGTGTNCVNEMTDGGFETGPNSGNWIETSTNFSTPISDLSRGSGGSNGPRSGDYWAWFGGVANGVEVGSLTKGLVFPSGDSISLSFYLEQFICDSPQDLLEIRVDGNLVFSTTGASSLCGVQGYSLQSIDLSTFADGNQHIVLFNSSTVSANGGITNFFVDDISFFVCDDGIPDPACDDTVTFANSNLAIPDNDPAGIVQSKTVSGISGTLGNDVQLKQVCFTIDHTWVGDLIVAITAPNGAQVLLTDRPGVPATISGCGGSNMSVCVETGTGNEMESVCATLPAISGVFTAANGFDLEEINDIGGSPNGTWQIFVSDNDTSETGTLVDWSLIFESGPVANWTSPGTVCATSGNVNLDLLVTGTQGGTWSGIGVSGNIFNPVGLNGPIPITYNIVDTTTGCSDNETNVLNVIPGAPFAVFAATPISLAVYFTNATSGNNTYLWDFGDISTSTDENPVHTYALGGIYTVTLTATNACGSSVFTQTITVVNCPTAVNDGGFENGPGSGAWTETSINFGTPICSLANCGNGGGSGPHTGTYWSFFGGVPQFEESSVSQSFTIPVNNGGMLYFWLEQISCDSSADFLKVVVDSDTLYTTTGGSNLCGLLGYSLINVNLTAYADGNPHTLKFFSRVYGLNGGATSFFVDDISVNVCIGIGFGENPLDQNLQVMPVPARDYIDVAFGTQSRGAINLVVTDMTGKSVYSSDYVLSGQQQTLRINTSGWSKGIYLLKATGVDGNAFRKVIIQ